MLKRKLTQSDLLLIIVNLIPVYGVWFEGWNAAQVFLVYCLETVIIGLFNVVKMACVTLFVKSRDNWQNGASNTLQSGWFFIFFFIVHYGLFVFIQTQIFFGVSELVKSNSLWGKYKGIPQALGNEGQLLLIIFIAYYTLDNLFNFFLSGEYKIISMSRLMFQPYGRIFVQQFVVILGSMFLGFGAGKVFIAILVAAKIFFEVYVNFDRLVLLAEKKQRLKNDRDVITREERPK